MLRMNFKDLDMEVHLFKGSELVKTTLHPHRN
jgi:hypothetical protein